VEKELAVSQRVWPRVRSVKLEELNLGTPEEPRTVLVAKDLDPEFKAHLNTVLTEYRDVFAWSYEDMKGINPEFYHHKINLAKDGITVQQRRYRLNPNYAAKVKEEIDKLLWVGFIKPVKRATWLSPIVVVPKKTASCEYAWIIGN
jgi:hypothetical protein